MTRFSIFGWILRQPLFGLFSKGLFAFSSFPDQPVAASSSGIVRLRSILRAACILAILLFCGCQVSRAVRGPIPSSTALGQPDHRTERVAQAIREAMRREGVPGLSVAVIENGELVWAQGFGWRDLEEKLPVDVETQFQAASISKPVTGLAALLLAEQGLLDLDTNVNSQLKRWKLESEKPVSIRQLLAHRGGTTPSGFVGYSEFGEAPSLLEVLNGPRMMGAQGPVKINGEPGAEFRYSGGGYCVVQMAIEDRTGKSFEAAMQETILDPLEMRRSHFMQPIPDDWATNTAHAYGWGHGVAYGGRWRVHPEKAAAGLWTTPQDLAKLVMSVQRATAGKAVKISAAAANEFLKGRFDAFMGAGVFLDGAGDQRGFYHAGKNWGYVSKFGGGVANGRGWVIMSNAMDEDIFDPILQAMIQAFGWK